MNEPAREDPDLQQAIAASLALSLQIPFTSRRRRRRDEEESNDNDAADIKVDADADEPSLMRKALEESLRSHRHHLQEQQRKRQEEDRLALLLHQQELEEKRLEDERVRRIQQEKLEKWAMKESYQYHREHVQRHQMNSYATDYIIQRTETKAQGCWDCPLCTFLNQPYATKCRACNAAPPVHVLTYRPFPEHLRFGLEIEMVVPQGRKDGFTLESMAKSLSELGPQGVTYEGYTHATHDHWKIVTDSSIHPSHSGQDLCFELVSPILVGEAGLGQLRNIMDNIRRMGIDTNRSCGFHVHVDAEEDHAGSLSTLPDLKRIAQAFVAMENAFDLIVASGKKRKNGRQTNRNRFCQSNRMNFGQMSNRQRWNTIAAAPSKRRLVELVSPDRYRKINLTNIDKHDRPSTVEFRHHGGVQDLKEAEAWVRLVLAFSENAAKGNNQICLLPESSNESDELRALFDLVDCRGLEQMFTVDRKLYIENLKNEWKCKACQRKFANSRSLAQHCSATGHRV